MGYAKQTLRYKRLLLSVPLDTPPPGVLKNPPRRYHLSPLLILPIHSFCQKSFPSLFQCWYCGSLKKIRLLKSFQYPCPFLILFHILVLKTIQNASFCALFSDIVWEFQNFDDFLYFSFCTTETKFYPTKIDFKLIFSEPLYQMSQRMNIKMTWLSFAFWSNRWNRI